MYNNNQWQKYQWRNGVINNGNNENINGVIM
jgi:hypothetical protein